MDREKFIDPCRTTYLHIWQPYMAAPAPHWSNFCKWAVNRSKKYIGFGKGHQHLWVYTYIDTGSVWNRPGNSGKWRFMGIPYWKCNNPGGHCYWEGAKPKILIYIYINICIHIILGGGYIPRIHHRFALFDPPKLVIEWYKQHLFIMSSILLSSVHRHCMPLLRSSSATERHQQRNAGLTRPKAQRRNLVSKHDL